jgi:carbon monoxide dehydrogenase subunit G
MIDIGERKFVVEAPQQRIWDILLRATMRLLPFERCNIQSDTEFSAILKMKVAFIKLPMNVEMKLVEIVPPEKMNTVLKAKGMGGLAWINQRSTFKLTPIDEGKTEVYAKIFAESMAPILRMFFLPIVKNFARDSFKSLEERLKQWA